MRLLKRQEIIDIWLKQDKKYLNYYCCPDCRNLLHNNDDDELVCKNLSCCNDIVYLVKEVLK